MCYFFLYFLANYTKKHTKDIRLIYWFNFLAAEALRRKEPQRKNTKSRINSKLNPQNSTLF